MMTEHDDSMIHHQPPACAAAAAGADQHTPLPNVSDSHSEWCSSSSALAPSARGRGSSSEAATVSRMLSPADQADQRHAGLAQGLCGLIGGDATAWGGFGHDGASASAAAAAIAAAAPPAQPRCGANRSSSSSSSSSGSEAAAPVKRQLFPGAAEAAAAREWLAHAERLQVRARTVYGLGVVC